LLTLGDAFGDDAQGYFQAGVLFVAVALIVQMVMWMRREGRTLKANLHGSLNIAADQANWIGVFLLAALAVMREGSEAAIFLYGTMAGGAAFSVAGILSMVLGFLAALATYAALQVGGSMLSWRTFFRVTEVMLLFLAASLLVAGVDHLISLGILPPLSPRLWDTSHLLADSGPIGGLVSGFTGYRAKPALTELVAYGAYWSIILWMLSRPLAGRSA
jgi:high-affinity iron transporter